MKTASEFNKVDVAATNQKENLLWQVVWCITTEGDRRPTIDDGINNEGIFIDDDYLFDSDDAQEAKNLCDYVLDEVDRNNIFLCTSP